MIKISAKLVKNHKTIKTASYNSVNEYDSNDFYLYISTLARSLDIETPIIIAYHRECFESFNSVILTADDFIDKINFDYMFIENDDR